MEIINAGPKFIGEFNRIDFTQNTPCFLNNIPVQPPKTSFNFWANDESGQLQRDIILTGGNLDIPLRGPMLSSWKTTFTVGWTLPTSSFINNNYILNLPLFPKTMPSSISEIQSKFILPEGSEILSIEIPSMINAIINTTKEIFNLDFKGRPVIEIKAIKQSTIDTTSVIIKYKLENKFNYLKIIYLSISFSLIFLSIVIFRRIDFKITSIKI